MIKIKEEKPNKKNITPYYELTFNYMIGDADGDTKEKINLTLDNPYIEKFVTAINKLSPTKGYWGVMLESRRIENHYDEGQITKEEYILLMMTMFEDDFEENEELMTKEEYEAYLEIFENDKFISQFFEGVRADAEYSFLVFQGCTLKYIDEYGVKHKTYFED